MAKNFLKRKKWNFVDYIMLVLILAGGFNWGLVGFFGFNLVQFLLGSGLLTKIVYGAVGISSLYTALRLVLMRL